MSLEVGETQVVTVRVVDAVTESGNPEVETSGGISDMAKTKKCPVCGITTKVENLEKHLKKVHPGEKVDLEYSEKEQVELKRVKDRDRELTSFSKKKIFAVLVVLILIVGAIFAFTYFQENNGNGELPNVKFDHSSYDLGTVTDPTTIYHEFTFENTGPGILRIDKVQTSCHCTTVTLEGDSASHGPFGMDGSPGSWTGHIAVGESVVMKVNYDTFYHGPSGDGGEQTRIINLDTNDPSYPVLKFELKVFITRT
jgi:hypothetical protein